MSFHDLIKWKDDRLTISRISEITGIPGRTLRSRYKSSGLDYFRSDFKDRSPWNLNRVRDLNDPAGQYVVGLIAADGCIRDNRSVSVYVVDRDVELLDRIASVLDNPFARINSRVNSTGSNLVGLNIGSIELVDLLYERYSLTTNKSRNLQFPRFLNNPLPFLRGFFDGDGYIGQSCTFTCGAVDFVEGLLDWVYLQYGYEPNVQMVGRMKDVYNIHFRKKHAEFIHDLFSYRGLERKTNKYREYLPNTGRDRSRG